jgi:hypothetical protein
MAPLTSDGALSARRLQYAGPPGLKGLVSNGKTTLIATFAALGGFVYGYNQGMFGQILTMPAFINRVSIIVPGEIHNTDPVSSNHTTLVQLVLSRVS